MRYAVLSDIHANLEALDAVLADARGSGVGAYISLGDIVGYGADPVVVAQTVRSLPAAISVAGNHDRGVLGLFDDSRFNENARAGIVWTRPRLTPAVRDYLAALPLVAEQYGATFVHGSLEDPGSFNYILNNDEACITMELSRTAATFVGHSHVAGIYIGSAGSIMRSDAVSVRMETGRRYLINAGSVGQPRDGDARAAYVVYDDAVPQVEIRRVAYDVALAQGKIVSAGLPVMLADRLGKGR